MKKGTRVRLLADDPAYDDLPPGTVTRHTEDATWVRVDGEAKSRKVEAHGLVALAPVDSVPRGGERHAGGDPESRAQVPFSGALRIHLDGKPVLVTARLEAALAELGSALLEQGRAVDTANADAWSWCRIRLGDLGQDSIMSLECGADQHRPDSLGEVAVVGV